MRVTIKDMTTHLEVSCRSEGEWERAIVEGFRIWSLEEGVLRGWQGAVGSEGEQWLG